MKLFLQLILASLAVFSASATPVHDVKNSSRHSWHGDNSQVVIQEMKMRSPGDPVKTPRKVEVQELPYYTRPAGAFYAFMFNDGAVSTKGGYLYVKPYSDYTYHAVSPDEGSDYQFSWPLNPFMGGGWYEGPSMTERYAIGEYRPPVLSGGLINRELIDFQYPSFFVSGFGGGFYGIIDIENLGNPNSAIIISNAEIYDDEGVEPLLSSKTVIQRSNDVYYSYLFTYISGADPDGKGYWFGKNSGIGKYRINGIAQAFEKPEHPYLLKQVVMECTELKVSAPVEMSCKVYQLDSIPAYQDDDEAVLPDEPGPLLCKGRAIITPESAASSELVTFTLYQDLDGLEVEATPAIDCAILVVIDGYNDPGMENLVNFSALISTNIHEDEGFGELAYLKFGTPVENSDQYRYVWAGLNNFFTSGEMKTGLSIYLSTELPYLAFKHDEEDGVYHFPDDGGLMEKQFNDTTTSSIEFLSWEPSADDYWWVHCNGNDVPDWLTIKLEDQMENGEFAHIVNARVTAEPLPQGVNYREAVVRFEYPGAYQDYKFIQSRQIGPNPPPEPNIATVNLMINIILGANYPEEEMRRYDINGDGVVNISDVNLVVHYIIEY